MTNDNVKNYNQRIIIIFAHMFVRCACSELNLDSYNISRCYTAHDGKSEVVFLGRLSFSPKSPQGS